MGVASTSGKPLVNKLGIKSGDVVLALDAPEHYLTLLAPLPYGAAVVAEGESTSIVHAFFRDMAGLVESAEKLVELPRPGGMLWISWPKKSSPMFVDLTEDGIRELLLPTGWVDVKVCAVDSDWSGLKFLRRRV